MNFVDFRVIIVILLRVQPSLVPIADERFTICIGPVLAPRVLIRAAIVEHIGWCDLDVLDAARVYFWNHVLAARDLVRVYHLSSRVNVIRKSQKLSLIFASLSTCLLSLTCFPGRLLGIFVAHSRHLRHVRLRLPQFNITERRKLPAVPRSVRLNVRSRQCSLRTSHSSLILHLRLRHHIL